MEVAAGAAWGMAKGVGMAEGAAGTGMEGWGAARAGWGAKASGWGEVGAAERAAVAAGAPGLEREGRLGAGPAAAAAVAVVVEARAEEEAVWGSESAEEAAASVEAVPATAEEGTTDRGWEAR